MARLTSLRTDAKKSVEGIWRPFDLGIEFLIAKKPNAKYEEKLAVLSEPYISQIHSGTLSPEVDRDLTMQAVIGTVLLDWKNVDDEEGNPIPCTPEVAYETLKQEVYEDVYNWILMTAHNTALFRMAITEGTVKNSKKSSNGK